MAPSYKVEYTTENPAYVEGRKMSKCFIGSIICIIILKVIYG